MEQAKAEITSILNAAENKAQTKQWILEALVDYGHLNNESNDNIQLDFKSSTFGMTSDTMELTVTESGPDFSESSTVEVNPNNKETILAKVKDIAFQQAIGQGFRELINWIL